MLSNFVYKLLLTAASLPSLYAIAITRTNGTSVACSPDAIPTPSLFGGQILSVEASEVHNYTTVSVIPGTLRGGQVTISFCNVTVTYTHPGWYDTVHARVWLPLSGWNGRFEAVGGGGYSTGIGATYLGYSVSQGYASADTDGGNANAIVPTDSSWSLIAPGSPNLALIEDYGHTATTDMTLIAKQIVKSCYGVPPSYSYFTGCSGGGRQAMMLAQRYPTFYDGIFAAAPAMNTERFIPAALYATIIMNKLGYYPPPCEVDAFRAAAIEACDDLDGLKDGIIARPALCDFNPATVVGQSFVCDSDNSTKTLTSAGAAIVKAAWSGPQGPNGWYGISKDADLHTYINTTCADNSTSQCSLGDTVLLSSFFSDFIYKNASYPVSSITEDEFFDALASARQAFASSLGAQDPDLSGFKANGGRLLTWHGGADEVIPTEGTRQYVRQVLELDKEATDFYRFFEAPGVGHCAGGSGGIPNGAFDALVAWVENGTVPEILETESQTGDGATTAICPFPKVQTFVGGNGTEVADFVCLDASLAS